MSTYLNRRTCALGWGVTMCIVWALFVPRGLSVTTFSLLGVTGLLVSLFGSMLWASSRPPHSVGQILSDLQSDGATAATPALATPKP
jgi:hypothetical protein